MIMKKTLFLLLVCISIVANAQPEGRGDFCPNDTANCPMVRKHNGHPAGNGDQWKQGNRGGDKQRMAFLKDLSEADRATVKEVMGEYHKECKAVMKKCNVQKPAEGAKPTEEQMDAMFKARTASRMEVLKLQEKYYDKLRKTLKPYQAAALLYMNDNGVKRPNAQGKHKGQGKR